VALVIAKELGDNALDAIEENEKGVTPDVPFTVSPPPGKAGIPVTNNGDGIPADTVTELLDFSVRASCREAYVKPVVPRATPSRRLSYCRSCSAVRMPVRWLSRQRESDAAWPDALKQSVSRGRAAMCAPQPVECPLLFQERQLR
jgi:hypothetical protein